MPPKKAVAAAVPATASRVSSRIKAAEKAATTQSRTSKRKAEEEAEQPAAKRGKQPAAPARKTAAAKPTKAASTKAAPAKATAKAPTEAAASKKEAATKAPAKKPAKALAKATATTKPIKAATGPSKRGPGRPKKTDVNADAATTTTTTNTTKTTKRKIEDTEQSRPEKKVRPTRDHVSINTAPTERLNVYVCGEGDMGELGLGTAKAAKNVKRPRLNPFLSSETVGVVQVATGGMHCVALTNDNKIITWGVNDQGACGRDTTWDGGLKDMDAKSNASDSEDEEDDNGLNPLEATPTAIPADAFPDDVKFVQVAAGDSISFALTDDGFLYGWGTFRSNEGILGFTSEIEVQRTPVLFPSLKNIVNVVCGANHVLALDANGAVFAWGSGQQCQLGRRVVERTRMAGLTPREFGLPRKQIKYIASGGYHSFAIDKKDNVWAWGLNNYGETGYAENAGEDDSIVSVPTKIKSLSGRKLTCIKGGSHHSIAVTEDGDCLVWGRADGSQMGIDIDTLPKEDLIHDEHGRVRILKNPTKVPGITCKYATAESDHSIAITTDGQAYSWGFSANYQTGQGTDDDVEEATLIDNTALRGKKLNWAGAGGQFSVLTGVASDVPTTTLAVNGNKAAAHEKKSASTANNINGVASPKHTQDAPSTSSPPVTRSADHTSPSKAAPSSSPLKTTTSGAQLNGGTNTSDAADVQMSD